MEKKKSRFNKKIPMIILLISFILIGIYFSMAMYFKKHFYFGSTINSINVSGKTVEEAEKYIGEQINSYSLELKDGNGEREEIEAAFMNLKYETSDELYRLKRGQNPYKWIVSIFKNNNLEMTSSITYNEDLLKETFNNLTLLNEEKIIPSEEPTFQYINGEFQIIAETNGNKIIKENLYNNVKAAISKGETSINLDDMDVYEKPKYTSNSEEIIMVKDRLNAYLNVPITYTFNKDQETVSKDVINTWLNIDENLEITFDKKKIRTDLNKVFEPYETVGKSREFKTSNGNQIKISGGDYGWFVNTTKEIEQVISSMENGTEINREPEYITKANGAVKNDIGNTYVEINLSGQYLWFYKDGKLITSGPIISGNVSKNHTTPTGVYSLKYKQRSTNLVGQDYNVPVDYWMPFNGGIGIHDASWRTSFGGIIYKTNGSHGCVNTPHYLAKGIYENIKSGVPIVCYY